MPQCQTCNETKTVIGVRTWVQKACNLKDSPVLLACDGEGFPEMGISNLSNANATYTNTYKTSCKDNCKKVVAKRTLGDPPDKTLDLVIAADCAGYGVRQLSQGGKLNIYLEFVCCCGKGATSFDQVDNYAVIKGVDVSVGYSIPNLTSLDGSEVDVQYSFSAVPFDDFYHNSATTASVVVSGSGNYILSATFLNPIVDCNDGAQCDGETKRATIDNQGTLTISSGIGLPQTHSVPGLAGATRNYLVQIGDKLYVVYSGGGLVGEGYACVTLGTNCVPQGDWTNVTLADITFIRGACEDSRGNLIVFGDNPSGGATGTIISIAPNGTATPLLETNVGQIMDVSKCGKNMVATSINGGVFKNTGCSGVFEQIIAPAGATSVVGAEVFGPNSIYVITQTGETFCTVDCAQTPWQPLPAANQATSGANDVEFYDDLFGVTYGPGGVSVTTNGGYTWSSSFMDVPTGFSILDVKFDCNNPGCALISGVQNGAGAALLMKPENC